MPKRGVFDEETKLYNLHKKRDSQFHEDYKKWREYWRERGPVDFAYQILKFDPNTGKPLILSEGQTEFLTDVGINGVRLAIIAAGRGSGKTFVLAVYIMWRIFTHDNYHIACMGGSQEQSDKIASYISGWIRNNVVLENYCLKLIMREVKTFSNGAATFHACSATSVRGPHCVSEDTMILTENGWKYFKELSYNDNIATLNSTTQKLEYCRPTEIISEDYEGEMRHIQNKNIDLLVTPNHRLFIKTNRWGWKINPLDDNFPKRYTMKRDCAGWEGKEEIEFILPEYLVNRGKNKTQHIKPMSILMDLWLEFFGYYISEGNTDNRKVKIRQSKRINPEKYQKMLNCIKQLPFPYKNYDDKFIIYSSQLAHYLSQFGSYAWTKYIPKNIKSLCQRQLKIFLDAIVIGDGHKTKTGILIGSSSIQLRDDYMELGLKCCYSVVTRTRQKRVHFFPKNNKFYELKEFHEVYMSKKGEIRFSPTLKLINERIHYKGKVYCVNVPNHIIFVKRNGKTVWSGNTHDVIIDEQASGEEKGGQRFIRAAIWEVSTSPDIHIIQSSTAHYIHGDFLQTWNNYQKLGYKRYNWAIAKHINGEKDAYKIYQDANPKNWVSNVPWIPDLNIGILRTKESNDLWLVEALGGISMTSGLVFNPLDLGSCLCDRGPCDICEAYKDGVCAIIQYIAFLEGIPKEAIPLKTSDCLKRYVHERVLGIDWGRGSPCAYVVLGRFKEWIFVLEALELVGQTDQEKVQIALDLCKKWDVEVVRPDPREWVLNNQIADAGYAVHELFSFSGGNEKYQYIATLKKYVERHKLLIPARVQSNDDLIRSLRNLTFDETGKIRKQDDHSSDACMYAISYYDEIETSSPVYDLKKDEQGLRSLW